MTSARGFLLVVSLGWALGCSGESSDHPEGDPTPGGGGSGNDARGEIVQPKAGKSICDDDRPGVSVDDLSGSWAYVEVQTQVVTAPGFADPFRNLVITSELWELEQDGETVTGTATICGRYVRSTGIVETTLPDALIESMEPFDISATYQPDGTFEVDRIHLVLGADLDDPTDKSQLPTEAEDPRVFDQEGDGEPGMTTRIVAGAIDGRIYAVQWSTMAPTGVTVSDDRIEGLLHFDATENIIGASNALLAAQSPSSAPHPESCWSTFQMERMGDSDSCTTILESLVDLFPDLASTEPP